MSSRDEQVVSKDGESGDGGPDKSRGDAPEARRAPDLVWRRDEPDSPCVQVCVIDPATRLCVGCGRTGGEIADWTRMGAEARAAIRAELPARQAAAAPKRGQGRRRRRSE